MDSLDKIWESLLNLKKESNETTNQVQSTQYLHCCKSCHSTNISEDRGQGDLVCTDCGIVLNERLIDEKAEWNFGQEESMYAKDPSRCGGPCNPLLEKSSMSTMITKCNYKNHGNLKKLHQQMSMDYQERSRYHIFEDIQKMAQDNGNLQPIVVEQSKHFYMKLSEKRLSRGSVRKGLIACCIYYACKVNKVSRSIKEISDMCLIETSVMNKCIKIFKDVMDSEINSCKNQNTDVDDLYCRFANKLCLSRKDEIELTKLSRKVSNIVDEMSILNGKTPTAITSSILFFCCSKLNLKVSKKQILEQHNISSVTLNKLISVLEENKEHFFQ